MNAGSSVLQMEEWAVCRDMQTFSSMLAKRLSEEDSRMKSRKVDFYPPVAKCSTLSEELANEDSVVHDTIFQTEESFRQLRTLSALDLIKVPPRPPKMLTGSIRLLRLPAYRPHVLLPGKQQ